MGCTADLRRVASAGARPRVPAAGRTADAHAPPTNVGLFGIILILSFVSNDDDAAPAAPDARACASDAARALALGAAERVELLVAAAAEEPGSDPVSPNWEGDGAVAEIVRR